ncbi:hypothetical protein GEOBRER4_n1267 [Citrifermentans bremense]|uniref:Uncharacterized protein n=1 Tax=Citrifermentans bremense TaxID=60035 RepID=A0A7R7FS06_9BACT|nr:hypothetical protein GEOBRER4_n1267 [Citrifermentans bremense]
MRHGWQLWLTTRAPKGSELEFAPTEFMKDLAHNELQF